MDLRAEILKEHSKLQTDRIVAWVGVDRKRFAELVHLFLTDEYRVVQRASWPLSEIAEMLPGLIKPHLPEIVGRMCDPAQHVAVKRNVVRLLQNVEIPEALHGQVMDTCFELLADPKETVAVRCFSMTVLSNFSKIYPEIRQELKTIIEDILQQSPTAGMRARIRILGLYFSVF